MFLKYFHDWKNPVQTTSPDKLALSVSNLASYISAEYSDNETVARVVLLRRLRVGGNARESEAHALAEIDRDHVVHRRNPERRGVDEHVVSETAGAHADDADDVPLRKGGRIGRRRTLGGRQTQRGRGRTDDDGAATWAVRPSGSG